jgi:hypothetical protein
MSEWHGGALSLDQWAADLRSIIDAPAEPVALLGISQGAGDLRPKCEPASRTCCPADLQPVLHRQGSEYLFPTPYLTDVRKV